MDWIEQNDAFTKNEDIFVVQKTGVLKKYWKKFAGVTSSPSTYNQISKFSFDIKIAEWHKFEDAFIQFDFGNQADDALCCETFLLSWFNVKQLRIEFNEIVVEAPNGSENLYSQLRPYVSNEYIDRDFYLTGATGISYDTSSVLRTSNKKIPIRFNYNSSDNGKVRFKLSEFSNFFKNQDFLYESRIKFEFQICNSLVFDVNTTTSYSDYTTGPSLLGFSSTTPKAFIYFQMYDLNVSYAHLLNKYLSVTPIKFNCTEVKRAFVISPTTKNTIYRGNINVNTTEFDSLCILPTRTLSTTVTNPVVVVSKRKFIPTPTTYININTCETAFNTYEFFPLPVFFSKFILTIDDKVIISYEKDNYNMNCIEYFYKYHRSIMKFPVESGPLGYFNIPLIFEFSRYFTENGYRTKLTNDKNIKFEFSYYSDIESIGSPDFHFLTINTRQFSYLNGLILLNKEF